MLDTVQMWSEAAQAEVTYSLSLESETDEGGNVHEAIVARYGEEVHRFSPRTTDEEFQRRLHPNTSDLGELHDQYRLQIVPR